MKFLLEVVLVGIASSLIINTLVLRVVEAGGDSLGRNASRLLWHGRIQNYGGSGGSDEEYEDYPDYDTGDFGDGDNLNDEGTVSSRIEGRGRRRSFGVSSQFWGQVLNIHTHHHKVVGVNWNQDQEEKTCEVLGAGCSSRQPCCEGTICKQWKCAKCAGDYGSCATIKDCCRSDQKCVNNKCTDWCAPARSKVGKCDKPSTLPCCGAYRCVTSYCKPRHGACASGKSKTCDPIQYPCCEVTYSCINGQCQQCRGPGDKCTNETDCCSAGARCIQGFCRKSKGNWNTIG